MTLFKYQVPPNPMKLQRIKAYFVYEYSKKLV